MSPLEFKNALLGSASADAPVEHAKARALAHVEHAMSAASVSSGALGAAKATGLSALAVKGAVALLVTGAVSMATGYELGTTHERNAIPQSSEPPAVTSTAARPLPPNTPTPNGAPPGVPSPSASVSSAPATPDVCEAAPEVQSSGACSKPGGHTVTFALQSHCAKTAVDVMWVDTSCKEVFRGMVMPGEVFWQDSWDTHVFRLRDHATHKLVKEMTAPVVEGAPDREQTWKGPRTELPLVVVREADAPITEAPPVECFHGGGRAATLHVKNERKDQPVFLMRVDTECKERDPRTIPPGGKVDVNTSEGHAFRIRDMGGQLLSDIPPTSLDTTTYLTVP